MNEQIIKDVTAKIAKYMGLTPVNNFYDGVELQKAGLPFACGVMGNGLSELKFHSSFDWIMPVVDKIEAETGYLMASGPFLDGETGKLSGEYFCQFIYQTTNLNMDAYIDRTGCSSRLKAIFLGVGEFLDKYYSQEEKNRRIKEKQDTIKNQIEIELNCIWTKVCDRPENHSEIVNFIYEDINGEPLCLSSVAIGFRHWIEAQQK